MFNKEKHGFTATFEIMLLALLVTLFIGYIVYAVTLYNQKRYFSMVATNTCIEASRYGGNNSKAYKLEVDTNKSIADNANAALQKATVPGFNATISVSDINYSTDMVNVVLTYNFLSGNQWWDTVTGLGGSRSVSVSVPSLVQYGKLLE